MHDCNCGDCGNEHIVTIEIDGQMVECTVLGVFEKDDQEYIALLTKDDNETLFLRYSEEESEDGQGSDFIMDPIDDDDEYDAVAEYFMEVLDEMDDDELDDEYDDDFDVDEFDDDDLDDEDE